MAARDLYNDMLTDYSEDHCVEEPGSMFEEEIRSEIAYQSKDDGAEDCHSQGGVVPIQRFSIHMR